MKKVLNFESFDGVLFENEQDCLNHENMVNKFKALSARLKPIPENDGCKFANGNGFIQQHIAVVSDVMVETAELAGLELNNYPKFTENPYACRHGIIGRIIDESGNRHACRLWSRFMCMDDSGCEWGQPYYTSHQEEAKCFEIKSGNVF